jgi:cation diffusion facilitator CzcD-associated flavoprotein CzcO
MAGTSVHAHSQEAATTLDAVVVGTGFAGLYMLHRLRSAGLSVQAFEAGDGVGGTWYWNRYPGARCDSESYYYSYSFSPELEQEWEWTCRYPEQPEILSYLNHVADRFELRPHIRLETAVASAHYDEQTGRWLVTTDDGATVSCTYFITAVGCLSAAQVPDVPGLQSFAGQWHHTGRWPHEGVDFAGKRVGVVGTGSTGIQAIPVIAESAAHLTVFQRTPNFSVPARNAPMTPERQREIKENYPEIRRRTRETFGGFPYGVGDKSALEVSEQERQEEFEAGWRDGGHRLLFSGFRDLILDQDANDLAADFVRSKIREIVRDPDTAQRLLPFDHPIGAKRPPIDTDYYETYNRDNVSLVDVRSSPIEEITPRGIRTTDDEFDLDVIVFATGFDAMTGALDKIDIRGRDGLRLRDKWAAGPSTYLGVATSSFPNMFLITGPGSPSVLSNMPVSIEQHVEWIADCIDHLRGNQLESIEATPQAEHAWGEHVSRVAGYTLFPLADSWYLGANIPGKPRVFTPYAGGAGKYRKRCDEIAAQGYAGFTLTGA